VRVPSQNRERGASLIIVILIIAFMLAVGVAILSISGISSRVSGSVREQEEAFNAAEAGFEAARMSIEQSLLGGTWANLGDNCLTTPAGIDLPIDAAYYRRQSDMTLVQTLAEGTPGVLFKDHAFLKTASGDDDMTRTFTVFLIEDDAGAAVPDTSDVMMVCIGVVRVGNRVLSTSRIEVLIGLDSGGNP
jgi:hypothetical protein